MSVKGNNLQTTKASAYRLTNQYSYLNDFLQKEKNLTEFYMCIIACKDTYINYIFACTVKHTFSNF